MFSLSLRSVLQKGHCAVSRNMVRVCSSSLSSLTTCEEKQGIRVVVLNNPKKRNVLSFAMLQSIKSHLVDSADLRCLVIRSTGPVFSSGHDLTEMTTGKGRQSHENIFHLCSDVMMSLQQLPVPVIAEVKGLATAAGCQLVASCDMVVASENARFATPGVNVGLFCSTPGIAVARAVPNKVAMEMLFTGQAISSQEAYLHGLVSKVVPEIHLEEETMRLAKRITESSKSVNALGKKFYYKQINMPLETAYKEGGQVMCDNLQMVDGQEGIKAFVGKRHPVWIHSADTVDS